MSRNYPDNLSTSNDPRHCIYLAPLQPAFDHRIRTYRLLHSITPIPNALTYCDKVAPKQNTLKEIGTSRSPNSTPSANPPFFPREKIIRPCNHNYTPPFKKENSTPNTKLRYQFRRYVLQRRMRARQTDCRCNLTT